MGGRIDPEVTALALNLKRHGFEPNSHCLLSPVATTRGNISEKQYVKDDVYVHLLTSPLWGINKGLVS